MTQEEFEGSIENDFEEYSQELKIWQANPQISPYSATVKIINPPNDKLEELYNSFSEHVIQFLNWVR